MQILVSGSALGGKTQAKTLIRKVTILKTCRLKYLKKKLCDAWVFL
jgi:hypothetical protein